MRERSFCFRHTATTVPVQSDAFWYENSPATFQRLINQVISNIQGCDSYIDDIIVDSSMSEQHVGTLPQLFERLHLAKQTVNLEKSTFGHAQVTSLVHGVGQDQVKPVNAKISAISEFP